MVKITYDSNGKNIEAWDAATCTVAEPYIEVSDDEWNKHSSFASRRVNLDTLTLAHDEDEERTFNDALVTMQRLTAYRDESDPLFFKEQAGEIPAGTWESKRREIKARFEKTINLL